MNPASDGELGHDSDLHLHCAIWWPKQQKQQRQQQQNGEEPSSQFQDEIFLLVERRSVLLRVADDRDYVMLDFCATRKPPSIESGLRSDAPERYAARVAANPRFPAFMRRLAVSSYGHCRGDIHRS